MRAQRPKTCSSAAESNSLGSLCEALRSESDRMRRAASERPRVYSERRDATRPERPIEPTSLSALRAWTASLMMIGAQFVQHTAEEHHLNLQCVKWEPLTICFYCFFITLKSLAIVLDCFRTGSYYSSVRHHQRSQFTSVLLL